VLLVDGANAPVNGQTITWTVTSGSAVLASGSSVTAANGHATMTFDFGSVPGPITISASAYGGLQTVTFNETAITASGVNKSSGDNQSGNPGATLAPFVVTISAPPGVTDLSGVPVTFTITSGTGTLSTTSTVTDAAGQASTTLTLGLTPGTVTVVAQVQNGPSTTFTATINGSLVATTLTIFAGDGQDARRGFAVRAHGRRAEGCRHPAAWPDDQLEHQQRHHHRRQCHHRRERPFQRHHHAERIRPRSW
jgi:hypothetical protein